MEFTYEIRDDESQQILRMVHQNSGTALIHDLQYEAARSASGCTKNKVGLMMDFHCTEHKETNGR